MNTQAQVHLLDDMLRAARNIMAFTFGLTEIEYQQDEKVQYAVTMALQIIGESAARLIEKCPDFEATRPELPLRQMRGMRNRIAHGYFTIDHFAVWDTVQNDIPKLIAVLEQSVRN